VREEGGKREEGGGTSLLLSILIKGGGGAQPHEMREIHYSLPFRDQRGEKEKEGVIQMIPMWAPSTDLLTR